MDFRTVQVASLALAACSFSAASALAQTCGRWTTTSFGPRGFDIAEGGGVIVTVEGSTASVSHDGVLWSDVALPFDASAIVWAADRFVVVGVGIATSADGLTWRSSPVAGVSLSAVAWNDSEILAVGAIYSPSGFTAVAVRSSDGVSWTTTEIAPSDRADGVTWAGDRWAVACWSGIFTSVDTVNWTAVLRSEMDYDFIAWNGQRLLAADFYGNWATSGDFDTWQTGTLTSPNLQFVSVAARDGRFLAVIASDWGRCSLKASADGATWTAVSLFETVDCPALRWTGARFLLLGGAILASVDGVTWELVTPLSNVNIGAIVWGAGRYVATAFRSDPTGHLIMTSDDAERWEQAPDAPAAALAEVVHTPSGFLALGGGGGVWRSDDGRSWTEVAPPGEGKASYYGIASNGGTLVVTGWTQTSGVIYTSHDGRTWTQAYAVGGFVLHDVAWDGRRFVAVGEGGTIVTSPDGEVWTVATLEPSGSADLRAVAASDSRYVAVGHNVADGMSVVYTSADALTWTSQPLAEAPNDSGLVAVVWTGSGFVAVGGERILASLDGTTWSDEPWSSQPGNGACLRSVASDGQRVAIASYKNSVLHSACAVAPPLPTSPHHVAVIPAVASVPGVGATTWTSEVVLQGPIDSSARVGLAYLERDRDNALVPLRTAAVNGPRPLRLRDVVATPFGRGGTAGALVIESATPLLVSSRTWTPGPHGSYGQYVPALDPADAAMQLRLIQLTSTAAFRTNVGVVSVTADPTSVTISFYRADGSGPIATRLLSLAPFGVHQLTDVLSGLGDVPDAFATVTADHPVLAYGSVVDRRTGDPTLILPTPPSSSPLLLAGAAHTDGFGSTHWRTDLEIHNPGPADAAFTLELLRERQANPSPQAVSYQLAAGRSVRYPDIVASVFAASGAAAIRLTPTQGAVTANARTYTEAPEGSYGQLVPAVPLSDAAASLRAIQLSQSSDAASGFRTNIGLVNLSGAAVSVTVELRRGDGTLLGTRVLSLQPFEYRQENRIVASVTSENVPEAYATISSSTPDAALLAYASVVDNLSGDPFWVPAR